MLRSVRIINSHGESMLMDLFHPEYTGMNITGIDGLGPNTATINTTEIATTDGSVYSSARLPERNMVFHITAHWPNDLEDVDPETIRHRTYQYFPIKQQIRMIFYADERALWIDGYVESNEPDIFNEFESFVISVICPDPWFKADPSMGVEGTFVFSGTDPAFEFIWENPVTSRTAHTPNTEFGLISHESSGLIPYFADVDAGMIITMRAIGTIIVQNNEDNAPEGALTPQADGTGEIKIFNELTNQTFVIDITELHAGTYTRGLLAGDVITIDTRKGHKGVRLYRNGEDTNILAIMAKDTQWVSLTHGDNAITFYSENESILPYLEFSITVEGLYEGV